MGRLLGGTYNADSRKTNARTKTIFSYTSESLQFMQDKSVVSGFGHEITSKLTAYGILIWYLSNTGHTKSGMSHTKISYGMLTGRKRTSYIAVAAQPPVDHFRGAVLQTTGSD